MEKDLEAQMACVGNVDSTHLFLCGQVCSDEINENFALYALGQIKGMGSKENSWQGSSGSLHLSFCIKEDDLPGGLPLAFVSIYFAYLLEEILQEKGSRTWLKWPNDLYLNDKKVGGIISIKISDFTVDDMGLDLEFVPHDAALCDVEILLKDLVQESLQRLEKKFLWKHIFSKYTLEFEKSRRFSIRYEGKVSSLENAFLHEDGLILLGGKRVYSLG